MEIIDPSETQHFDPGIRIVQDVLKRDQSPSDATNGNGQSSEESDLSNVALSLAGATLLLTGALVLVEAKGSKNAVADGYIPPGAYKCLTPGVDPSILASPPCYAWAIGPVTTTTGPVGSNPGTTQPGGNPGTTHTGTTQPAFNWNAYFSQQCSAPGDGEPDWLSQVPADPAMRIGQIINSCPDNVMLTMIQNPAANVTHTQQQVDNLSLLIWNKYAPTTTATPAETTSTSSTTTSTTTSSTVANRTTTSVSPVVTSSEVSSSTPVSDSSTSQESTTTTSTTLVAVKPPSSGGGGSFHLTYAETVTGLTGAGVAVAMLFAAYVKRHKQHSHGAVA